MNRATKAWRPQEVDRHRAATMNWGDNFGLIAIDWDRPDPRITLQIRDSDGEVFLAQKLDLGTLRRRPLRGTR
jgi:hypothetical protein